MYESNADAIRNAIDAANANNTFAYEVYIKASPRGKTIVNISFAKNPGELTAYWYGRMHEYGDRARVTGYVALNSEA